MHVRLPPNRGMRSPPPQHTATDTHTQTQPLRPTRGLLICFPLSDESESINVLAVVALPIPPSVLRGSPITTAHLLPFSPLFFSPIAIKVQQLLHLVNPMVEHIAYSHSTLSRFFQGTGDSITSLFRCESWRASGFPFFYDRPGL